MGTSLSSPHTPPEPPELWSGTVCVLLAVEGCILLEEPGEEGEEDGHRDLGRLVGAWMLGRWWDRIEPVPSSGPCKPSTQTPGSPAQQHPELPPATPAPTLLLSHSHCQPRPRVAGGVRTEGWLRLGACLSLRHGAMPQANLDGERRQQSCGARHPPTPHQLPARSPGKLHRCPQLPAHSPRSRRQQQAPEQRSLWKGSACPGDAPPPAQPPPNPLCRPQPPPPLPPPCR